MPKRKIEINRGDIFGWLEVLEPADKDRYNNYQFKCICRCGNKVIVRASNLKSGNSKSCKCAKGTKNFK